jgi:AcrR family transcriptional regulator
MSATHTRALPPGRSPHPMRRAQPKENVTKLNPRKTPCQLRSTRMVSEVVDAAAQVLEHDGLNGYTTGKIAARAGISVGSLYQYFPNKDAVTVALIERESTALTAEVGAALQMQNPKLAIREMIKAAVCGQFRRPALARILDFEEARLVAVMPPLRNTTAMRGSLEEFLVRNYFLADATSKWVANDVIEIVRALADASAQRPHVDISSLELAIEAAVCGYLSATLNPRPQSLRDETL